MRVYQEQHYEDVAKILSEHGGYVTARVVTDDIVRDFADLFAADNPAVCRNCTRPENATDNYGSDCSDNHEYVGGFDRERFLKACGLEPLPA